MARDGFLVGVVMAQSMAVFRDTVKGIRIAEQDCVLERTSIRIQNIASLRDSISLPDFAPDSPIYGCGHISALPLDSQCNIVLLALSMPKCKPVSVQSSTVNRG